MENDDIFAKINFFIFNWVPPSKFTFRPLCIYFNMVLFWIMNLTTSIEYIDNRNAEVQTLSCLT